MNQRKGFTIIELLVVVGIIGLLAALAVVSFGSAQKKARDGKRVADMKSVLSSLNAAAVSEPQPLLCTGGGDIAAITPLADVQIMNGSSCAGGTDVTKNYINLAVLKDPSFAASGNCTFPVTADCNYTIDAGASIVGQTPVFSVGFTTEGDKVTGIAQGTRFHTATAVGMQ